MSIFTRFFNRLGLYESLAARFPGGAEPQGARWERQCVGFSNTMRYDWCVTVVVATEGLWVQARPPAQGVQAAIFVPWRDVVRVDAVRLYWRRAARLTCGDPPAGTIIVWRPVWEAADAFWRAAHPQAAWPQAAAPATVAAARQGLPPPSAP